jgi:hypothetical protein
MPGTRSGALIPRCTKSGLDSSHHIDVVTGGLRRWILLVRGCAQVLAGVKSDFKSAIEGAATPPDLGRPWCAPEPCTACFRSGEGRVSGCILRNQKLFPPGFRLTQMARTGGITPDPWRRNNWTMVSTLPSYEPARVRRSVRLCPFKLWPSTMFIVLLSIQHWKTDTKVQWTCTYGVAHPLWELTRGATAEA